MRILFWSGCALALTAAIAVYHVAEYGHESPDSLAGRSLVVAYRVATEFNPVAMVCQPACCARNMQTHRTKEAVCPAAPAVEEPVISCGPMELIGLSLACDELAEVSEMPISGEQSVDMDSTDIYTCSEDENAQHSLEPADCPKAAVESDYHKNYCPYSGRCPSDSYPDCAMPQSKYGDDVPEDPVAGDEDPAIDEPEEPEVPGDDWEEIKVPSKVTEAVEARGFWKSMIELDSVDESKVPVPCEPAMEEEQEPDDMLHEGEPPTCREDPSYHHQYPGCPHMGGCPAPRSCDYPVYQPVKRVKKKVKPSHVAEPLKPEALHGMYPGCVEESEDCPRQPAVDTTDFRPNVDALPGEFDMGPF